MMEQEAQEDLRDYLDTRLRALAYERIIANKAKENDPEPRLFPKMESTDQLKLIWTMAALQDVRERFFGERLELDDQS